jgi:hypothetical protein
MTRKFIYAALAILFIAGLIWLIAHFISPIPPTILMIVALVLLAAVVFYFFGDKLP